VAIDIERFALALRAQGVDFFTGVPCSYFQSFVSYASASDSLPYTIAASEGEAIGIATGAWLSGRMGAVLLQNSGLGNCVNPLTSLSATFEIPLLLLISHRGEQGDDAPQHDLMGEITYDLLEAMRIPAFTLAADDDGAQRSLEQALGETRRSNRPVALVVPKGRFERFTCDQQPPHKAPSRCVPERLPGPSACVPREQALRELDRVLDERDLVVTTTGMTSRELFTIRDRPGNFYMLGSMGCAAAIGLGLTRCAPDRKLVVLDGDGALLMKLGTAATIGHYRPRGLLHVVLDNGTYETTGGQPTTSCSVAFEQIAAGAGYARSLVVNSPSALAQVVAEFEVGQGPLFVTLAIRSGHMQGVGRVGRSPQQIRDDFRHAASESLRVS